VACAVLNELSTDEKKEKCARLVRMIAEQVS
jgi:hypothetical protein